MEKKIFSTIVVLAISVYSMININLNKVGNKGNLKLANVENLVQAEELPPVTITCNQFNGRCWVIDWISPIMYVHCLWSGAVADICYEG